MMSLRLVLSSPRHGSLAGPAPEGRPWGRGVAPANEPSREEDRDSKRRRRRNGLHARPVQHRCRESGVQALIRRSDEHHPNGAELRSKSRVRDPRDRSWSELRSRVTTSLLALGVPKARASVEASSISQSQGGTASASSIPHFARLDFAYATRTVLLHHGGDHGCLDRCGLHRFAARGPTGVERG
jgi:hypothetical protein